MSGRKCVVTGAGGFIGWHLANALSADGWEVAGIDLHFPQIIKDSGHAMFEVIEGDFRDGALVNGAFSGASVVFHLASAHLQVTLPESEYWDVNVHSVPTLLSRAAEAGVTRCVHTSSVGVYGDVGSRAAVEDTNPRPQSIYGRTKLAGEEAALQFGRKNGFEVVVLRPAWVYGPGCPRTEKICRALQRRRFVMIGSGRNMRHPVYIEDMVEAFRLASSESSAVGQIINVAGERAVTSAELIETFCQVFEFPRPPMRLPYAVGATAAVCAESVCSLVGREPPLSRRTLEFFSTNNNFDISRAKEVLGFAPRYSLNDGLAATRRVVAELG